MSPKYCLKCETQGLIIDSRPQETHVYRRYECPVCKSRWSSCEFRLDEVTTGKEAYAKLLVQLTRDARNEVADKLISLAQELMV